MSAVQAATAIIGTIIAVLTFYFSTYLPYINGDNTPATETFAPLLDAIPNAKAQHETNTSTPRQDNNNNPGGDTDDDGDGFTTADGDCDDSNPDVNPDASEDTTNGIDDNCNGEIDEGAGGGDGDDDGGDGDDDGGDGGTTDTTPLQTTVPSNASG